MKKIEDLSRREFLKGAAVGVVGVASLGVLAACSTTAPVSSSTPAPVADVGGTAPDSAVDKKANRVCELLGIEKPVVQAIMSALDSPELAAAVSSAGGLGLISAGDVDTLRADIQKVKSLTDKPFGVAFNNNDEIIDVLKEEGVKIVFFLGLGGKDGGLLGDGAYGVDADGIKKAKDSGFTVIFRDVNCTVEAALKAEAAGADIIVLSGYGNGGHMSETRVTINSLMAEAQGKFKAPLMCSGNIATKAHADAAAAMGAEGVYVGTRFNASTESPCSQEAKDVIVNTKAEDLVEWRGILGFVRGTDTPFTKEVVAASDAGASRMDLTGMYSRVWNDMRNGTISESFVCMSDCVNSITGIKSCKEIVEELGAAFV